MEFIITEYRLKSWSQYIVVIKVLARFTEIDVMMIINRPRLINAPGINILIHSMMNLS